MVKSARFIIGIVLLTSLLAPFALAAGAGTPSDSSGDTTVTNFTASRVSECKSKLENKTWVTPYNCLYLEEPIGGRPNYDLFKISCSNNPEKKGCNYELWGGESIQKPYRGPVQAILTFTPDQQEAKGFALFYNYLALIYKYMSGVIVGMVVLFIIVGGIQMTTSAGDTTKFDEGKKRIQKAIVGMIVWFLASLILYTINPTFFAF